MNVVHKIFKRINGLQFPQEYLCLSKESFTDPLRVYIVQNGKVTCDVTNTHAFIGYQPLLLATFYAGSKNQLFPDQLVLCFSKEFLHPNEEFNLKDAIATLRVRKTRSASVGGKVVAVYEGMGGHHHFQSIFHQWIARLDNRLVNKRKENVFLEANLYQQVQIAYALPRVISLITVSGTGGYNLFPTDLHGEIGGDHYMISLRHEGKACRQVRESGRLLISTVESGAFKEVYLLGKNHMQEPKDILLFPFSAKRSVYYNLPIPDSAIYCREMEVMDSFILGIHRIFTLKILSRRTINDKNDTLAHVHNAYASWRHNKGMTGNYLLR
jgi:hypothetical protein